MPDFTGKGDGYENPSYKGDEGDRKSVKGAGKSVANGAGGSVKGDYDNATAKTTTPQIDKKSRLGGGGAKQGYDNIKSDQDLGFSGHGKDSLGRRG